MEKIKAIFGKIKAFFLRRKKKFYIILIVISSLLLLFDLSVRLLMPDTSMLIGAAMSGFSADGVTMPDSDSVSSGDASESFGTGDVTFPDSDGVSSGDASENFGTEDVTLPDSGSTQDFDSDSFASGDASLPSGGTFSGGNGDAADGAQAFSGGGSASGDAAAMPDMSTGDTGGSGSDGTSSSAENDTESSTDNNTSNDTENAADENTQESASLSISLPWPMRILMGIRSAFWLILIPALLVDAFSIVMLITVSRRQKEAAAKAERERIAEAFAQDGEVHLVRPKEKKKISSTVWIIIVAVIFLLVLLVKVLSSFSASETSETEASVYSAEVESGDISTVLPGTGTLTEEDAEDVSLPSEVEVTAWYVENGDTVEEGDVLAKIDTDSALSAIASVQEVITSLDEALAELEDSDTTGTVTAAAGGRVKAVYAQEDESVIDTIYESGSLMLLSLDGLMAVSFETESDVTVGDSVTVTLSDGTEEEGTVESALDGTVVVTLTDEDTDLGDDVTVTDADGNELGSGTLYIHSELSVLSFSGTVSSVSVSAEDEVDAGDTLLSLTDVDNTFETALLVEQRSELEAQIQTLFRLYQDGYLYAETAGVISGLSDSSASSSDASESTSENDESTESTDSSVTETGSAAASGTLSQAVYAQSAQQNVVTLVTEDAAETTVVRTAEFSTGDDADSSDSSGTGDDTASEGTADTQTDSTDTDTDSTDTDTDSTDTDTGSTDTEDSESTDTEDTGSSYVNYIALVTEVGEDTVTALLYQLSGSDVTDSGSTVIDLSSTAIYISSDGELTSDGTISDISAGDTLILMCSADDTSGNITPICVIAVSAAVSESSDSGTQTESDTDAQTEDESDSDTQTDDTEDGALSGSSQSDDAQSGSDSLSQSDDSGTFGQDADTSAALSQDDASSSDSLMQDASEGLSEDAASAYGTDTSGSTDQDTSALSSDTDTTAAETAVTETLTEEVSANYSVSETTYLSITPQTYVYVTITIDELDILSVETGLTAEVTLDAFPGQSFEGVVESIDTSGTNEGGNSKYTAVVRIERTEDMLAGMNASVKITLDTTEDVLTVPAEALIEEDGVTYVYTSYDEKTEELGDPVEVETGVSDGINVEIVSGLSEGDTYYYSVLDTVNYSTSTVSRTSNSLF